MNHWSSGGITSADFQLDELERAAAALRRAGEDVGAAARCLDGSLLALARLAVFPEAMAAVPAEFALQAAALRAETVRGELLVVAGAVERSRAAYEEAEQRAVRSVNEARERLLPLILVHDLATNAGRPRTSTVEDLINHSPAIVGELLALLFPAAFPVAGTVGGMLRDKAHGGMFDSTVAERLYPQLAGVATGLGWVRVGPIDVLAVGPRRRVAFSGDLPGLLRLQREAEMDRAGPGAVQVTTVETTDGPVHVVALPGTQTQDLSDGADFGPAVARTPPPRANPWDTGGVVEGAGLGSQHVAEATLEALAAVGAEPGDRLVFTGYSQGGMHAANLAADSRIRAAYDVEYVVTVGSPVGGIDLPEDVRALHLEHVDDPVPGADGERNPATAQRVSVYLEGYAPGTQRVQDGFGAAHGVENYMALAGALPASGDPAVGEAQTALGTVFAGSGAATTRTVALHRSKHPPSLGLPGGLGPVRGGRPGHPPAQPGAWPLKLAPGL